MKTSGIVLFMLIMLAIFSAGCSDDTTTGEYEENVMGKNLIVPTTFQEISDLFLELTQITLYDDQEEYSISYTYDGTEVINGVEAAKFIFQSEHISYGKQIAEAWYDSAGNLVQHTIEGDNIPPGFEAETVDGYKDNFIFLFEHLYNDDHQGIFNAIIDDSDYRMYTFLGSSIESFGDLEAPVYTIGIMGGPEEDKPPTMYYDIVDFGDFQTVVGLTYSEKIVDTGQRIEFRINKAVLNQD